MSAATLLLDARTATTELKTRPTVRGRGRRLRHVPATFTPIAPPATVPAISIPTRCHGNLVAPAHASDANPPVFTLCGVMAIAAQIVAVIVLGVLFAL